MKIILTGTASDAHTWNLVYLQVWLEERGHRVLNLGSSRSPKDVAATCAIEQPDVLVVSSVNGHGAIDGVTLLAETAEHESLASLRVVFGGLLTTRVSERPAAARTLLAAGAAAVFTDPESLDEFAALLAELQEPSGASRGSCEVGPCEEPGVSSKITDPMSELDKAMIEESEIHRCIDQSRTRRLLEGARAGDQDAISELQQRVRPTLRSILKGRTPDQIKGRMDTEDALQDVENKILLTRLGGFVYRGPGSFAGWAGKVALDRRADGFRLGQRGSNRFGKMRLDDDDSESGTPQVSAPGPQPVAQNEREEMFAIIVESLGQYLSPEDVEAAVMHYGHHVKWTTLAEERGCKTDTLRKRVKKAFERSRDQLAGLLHE